MIKNSNQTGKILLKDISNDIYYATLSAGTIFAGLSMAAFGSSDHPLQKKLGIASALIVGMAQLYACKEFYLPAIQKIQVYRQDPKKYLATYHPNDDITLKNTSN